MKCLKCGANIPAKSKFCLSCGEPVPQLPTDQNAETSETQKRIRLAAIIAALIIVALIASLFALKSRNDRLLSANANKGIQSPILRAPSEGNEPMPGVLGADSRDIDPQTGLLQGEKGPQTSQNVAASDVVAYINHIKKVEQYRQSMRLDLSPAMQMLTDAFKLKAEVDDDEAAKMSQALNKGYSGYLQRWQQILAYFNSVPPPPSCQALAGAYGDALSKYSNIMIKIQYALNKRDINMLMELKQSAQKDVDNSLQKADQELAALCKTYGLEKTFSIEPDRGMESLLSTGF